MTAFHCKGICTRIAAQQNTVKKQLFKQKHHKKDGRRPATMSICTISKYCKQCDERFYFIDYGFCKCCGCKLRSRNHLTSLGALDKEKLEWFNWGLEQLGPRPFSTT